MSKQIDCRKAEKALEKFRRGVQLPLSSERCKPLACQALFGLLGLLGTNF